VSPPIGDRTDTLVQEARTRRAAHHEGGVMRRILTIAAGITLVLGAAAPAASASTTPVTQVIHVKAIQQDFAAHGHSISFTETLWQEGKKVGTDAVTCTFRSPSPTAVAPCTGVFLFRGSGDLFVSATPNRTNGAKGRVIGGTGAFTNAQGTLLVVSPSSSSNVSWITLTFHV
jgi:hypothetical protein